MTTKADELRAEMAQLDRNIEANIVLRRARMERVKLIHDYVRQLRKRQPPLEAQLAREEAPLIKPQPKGAREGCFDV